MALRKIVEIGEDCLNKVCRPVTEFNPHLHVLLDDMAETLADANGAGLAAPRWACCAGSARYWTRTAGNTLSSSTPRSSPGR